MSAIDDIAASWRTQRDERQRRRHLDPADFDALRRADLWRWAVPEGAGGRWRDAEHSTRPIGEALRTLAAGDPSPALVASMHPAVLSFWLTHTGEPRGAWEDQRQAVFARALAGEQWGTVTSEPGSGGDLARTRSVATPTDETSALPGAVYALSGDKHFGSGLGVADWMITTAVPAGESGPAIFVIDLRDRPLDGRGGVRVVAEWDGMGMAATQSHAVRLEGVPAVRFASDAPLPAISQDAAPIVASLLTSVILGVVDEAVAVSRQRLLRPGSALRPYEQVEWAAAEQEHWLAVQAHEGGLRALEAGASHVPFVATLRAKAAVAELGERALTRLCRVHGGGTFSARSPFAHWFEDVRALGFLRPPWALTHEMLLGT